MKKNNQQQLNKIIVILGPTSAGKSAVAISLAKKFDGEVVSVDSRQIYRGMDAGTGKIIRDKNPKIQDTRLDSRRPLVRLVSKGFFDESRRVDARRARYKQISNSKTQKSKIYISEGVVHHMIDVVSPKTNFSAAQFKKKADKAINDILKRGKLPILCGGTGFWIKSIVDNVTYPEVKPDWKLRKKLGQQGITELIHELEKLDPERAKNIDQKNKVRLIRAIEICRAIGKVPPLTSYQLPITDYEFLQIGVSVPKVRLHAKIKKRLDDRWRDGMVEEVKRLHQEGLSWKKIESFGLGYFWIPEYLQEKITLEELYEKVYLAEKDYAKRQMTWFTKDKRILWLEKYQDMEKEAQKFIKSS